MCAAWGGLPRVFAEWVDGGSLHDAIAIESLRLYEGTGEEVLARILDVAIQFAWGLDYAHSRGLIHRDVKPRNAMLTADWAVKGHRFRVSQSVRRRGGWCGVGAGGHGDRTICWFSDSRVLLARAGHRRL